MRLFLSRASAVCKPKRRWFQFSLGTLFLVMTAFGVWLGLTVDRIRRQRAAVAAILDLGGTVYYDYQVEITPRGWSNPLQRPARPAPEWLCSTLGVDALASVVHVELDHVADLTNADLVHLRQLPDVRTLFICGDKVTGDALVHLRHLDDLEDLSLGINLTDADLAHLKPLQSLRWLFLMGPRPRGYVVRAIGRTDVYDVDDYDSSVTSQGVHELSRSLPRCRISY